MRILILAVTALFSIVSVAQESTTTSMATPVQERDLVNPQGFWPFVGFGLGQMTEGDGARTEGMPIQFKLLGSYYFPSQLWVGDLGVGLQHQTITQSGEGRDAITTIQVEGAARYQLGNKWQLGPIVNHYIGGSNGYASNTDGIATFIGGQILKEFVLYDTFLSRVGGRVMTDVGLRGDQVHVAMLEFQVSLDRPRDPKPAHIAVKDDLVIEQPLQEPPAPAPAPIAPHLANRAMQTYDITPLAIHFNHGSTKMVASADKYARRLARVLANNDHLFKSVEIVGHTDQTGTNSYNQVLSLRRAAIVAERMIAAGMKKSKIMATGRGEQELFTDNNAPAGLLLNRRVQLRFHGVTNEDALAKVIDSAGG